MRASKKKLKELREKLKIQKSSIEGLCSEHGFSFKKKNGKKVSQISQKTYYNMEEGLDVKERYFEIICQLFSIFAKRTIQKSEILLDQSINSNIITCYLYRANSVGDLKKSISKSLDAAKESRTTEELKKHVIYDVNINPEIENNIKQLFDIVSRIRESEYMNKLEGHQKISMGYIHRFQNDLEGFDNDLDFHSDLNELNIQASGNQSLTELSKIHNLSLYVGHITIPIVDFKRDSLNDDPKKYVDEEEMKHILEGIPKDNDGEWEKVSPIVVNQTYTLFYFAKSLGDTVQANYRIKKSYKEIIKTLDKIENNRDTICYTYSQLKKSSGRTFKNSLPDPINSYKLNWFIKKVDFPYSLDSKSFDFNRVKNQSFKLDEQKIELESRELEIKNQEKQLELDRREDAINRARISHDLGEDR